MENVEIIYGKVVERDMDLLFAEAIVSDRGFVKLFLQKAGITCQTIKVIQVELSKIDGDLGESDITVKISLDGKIHGLLIEDKIDAIAMKSQCERYIERGKLGVKNGEYELYHVFLICPQRYYENNKEAAKYEHVIFYEECLEYLSQKSNIESIIRCQRILQAIEKSKRPSQILLNEKANAFFIQYKTYQEIHFPELDLRTKSTSNGYWTYYATRFGNKIYLYHKILQGTVDLTFTSAGKSMGEMDHIAIWLQEHGFPEVYAVKTGQAGALRINVPKLDMYSDFAETSTEELDICFKAISKLVKMADFCEMVSTICD